MPRCHLTIPLVLGGMLVIPGDALAMDRDKPDAAVFEAPVRMRAGDAVVKVEAPGYAAPCWTDVNGDDIGDLVVGQFNGGKMKVYLGSEDGLQPGAWVRADGEIAEVPGVW